MPQRVLNHLRALVACDTQNPPRTITGDDPIFAYCARVLGEAGCTVTIEDLGDGCVNLLATRGKSDLLFNCHLDTVPADPAWSSDPFSLIEGGTDAVGLGACDIKGAAACLLAAAETTSDPMALLLTSDEEAGDSTCIKHFIHSANPIARVIVCEPTGTKAVTRHRGIETYELEFSGQATHSSSPSAHGDNALHLAARWSARALAFMHEQRDDNLRFNIGIIKGGVKTNIAASSATVRFGIRPHADTDVAGVIGQLLALLDDPERSTLHTCFSAPALDSGDPGRAMIKEYGLEQGKGVDFWTEAALFAQGGYDAIVLGPGDIRQAHTPDEAVPIDDLYRVTDLYRRIISQCRPAQAPTHQHSTTGAHQS